MALERREEAARAFETHSGSTRATRSRATTSRGLAASHDPESAFRHVQSSVQADPSNADAWLLLADLLRRRKDYSNAMRAMNLAIERAPQRAAGWAAAREPAGGDGRGRDGAKRIRRGLGPLPRDLRCALGACLTLPQSMPATRISRRAAPRTPRDSSDCTRTWIASPSADAESVLIESRWTNFYLAYQGRDDRVLQERYGDFQARLLQRAAPDLLGPRPRRTPGARLRIGFLSHYFYNCVVGRYFSSWITRLDAARFEKFVYYTNSWVGDDTAHDLIGGRNVSPRRRAPANGHRAAGDRR
jgi:predicted O-linked N-acetylglucosamine transferase (SPINDLY family)